MGLHTKGKQAMVALLKGPKDQVRLARLVGMTSGFSMKKTLTKNGFVQVTSKGLMLTEKGIIQAIKFESDLKNWNLHPDQLEPKVIRQPVAPVMELAGGGAVDDTIDKRDDVDWQQRHIDYLEKLCMELAKSKQ